WSRLASAPEIAQVMMTGSSRLTARGTLAPGADRTGPVQMTAAARVPRAAAMSQEPPPLPPTGAAVVGGRLAVVPAGVGLELAARRATGVLRGVHVRVVAARVPADRAHDARLRRDALLGDAGARALPRRPCRRLEVDDDGTVHAGLGLMDVGCDRER